MKILQETRTTATRSRRRRRRAATKTATRTRTTSRTRTTNPTQLPPDLQTPNPIHPTQGHCAGTSDRSGACDAARRRGEQPERLAAELPAAMAGAGAGDAVERGGDGWISGLSGLLNLLNQLIITNEVVNEVKKKSFWGTVSEFHQAVNPKGFDRMPRGG